MEQLTIDTGLREYAVNGGPEHGGGVLRFNPSDPNVYSRFCTLQNQLQELEQQVQAQSPTGTDAIQLLAQADQRAKGLLAEVMEDLQAGQMAGFEAVVSVLREILSAVYGIELTDEDVGRAVQRWQRKQAIATGGV